MSRGETPAIKNLHCPACLHATLFLDPAGHITCGNTDCPQPDYATALDRAMNQREYEIRTDELSRAQPYNLARHFALREFDLNAGWFMEYCRQRQAELDRVHGQVEAQQ